MSNAQATGARSLGLSVGATNLAGTREGQAAFIRPSELTLQGQRLTGFVDRIGDPVPLVARDGSQHRAEILLAEALSAMALAVTRGAPLPATAVAVPAHWPPATVDSFRRRMHLQLVSDASAALTALRANPGLPTHGVIVLCDFGGSGTSISLADAASDFAPIGETVRFSDFSGDHVDQALLTHVVAEFLDDSHADPASTAMVGSLTQLRGECRAAKERLSAETATAVAVDLPAHRTDIRVTRTELEDLIRTPFAGFLVALDDTLQRAGVAAASLSAVATVGGGARIPVVTQRLSEHLRAPVVTTLHPQLTAAEGAALIASRSRIVEAATTITPAPRIAAATAIVPTGSSTASGALAWSEDTEGDSEFAQRPDAARPELQFQPNETEQPDQPRRSPIVLFGLSAAAAVIAATVFGVTLLSGDATTPVEAATTVAPAPAPAAPVLPPTLPAPQAPQVTTVVMQAPQRSYPAPQQPRPLAPVTQQPVTTPTTTVPTTTTPVTTSTEPTTDPTPPPTPPTSPEPPPIDPGPGDGGTTPPPIDPGDGSGTGTPPIDPGDGAGGTGTGTPPIDPGDGAGGPGA